MSNNIHIENSSVGTWLRYHFLEKKLNTRFGYFFLAVLGIGLVLWNQGDWHYEQAR